MATRKVPNAYSFWQAWLYARIPNLEEIIDPNNPLHQIAVQTAIYEMANLVADRTARAEIQGIAKKAIGANAQKFAK